MANQRLHQFRHNFRQKHIQDENSNVIISDSQFRLNPHVTKAIEDREAPEDVYELLYGTHQLQHRPEDVEKMLSILLCHAVHHDYHDLVKFLINEKHCHVNWHDTRMNRYWPRPLHVALKNVGTSPSIISLLVEHGANVHTEALMSVYPIFRIGMTIEGVFINDDVQKLISLRTYYKASEGPSGQNLFHLAARHNAEDCLKYLIEDSSYSGILDEVISCVDKRGLTPLLYAAKRKASILRLLLSSGTKGLITEITSPNEEDANGVGENRVQRTTPLQEAVRRPVLYEDWENIVDMPKIVKLLVEAGANLNVLDKQGNSVLGILLVWFMGFTHFPVSIGANVDPWELSTACLETINIFLNQGAIFAHKTFPSPIDMISKSIRNPLQILMSLTNWTMEDHGCYLLASFDFMKKVLSKLLEDDAFDSRQLILSCEPGVCSSLFSSLHYHSGILVSYNREAWYKPAMDSCLSIIETCINYGVILSPQTVMDFAILDVVRRHSFLHLMWQTQNHRKYVHSLENLQKTYVSRFGQPIKDSHVAAIISSPRRLRELARVTVFTRLPAPQKVTALDTAGPRFTRESILCSTTNKTHWV